MTRGIYFLEEQLQAWAYWVVKKEGNELGFPKCSIYANMTRVGPQANIRGQYYLPTHDIAERIENYIKELAERHADLAKTLRFFYCEMGSYPLKAKRLGLSCTQFKTNLQLARYWLAGRMRL